jgi:hypothetical protein
LQNLIWLLLLPLVLLSLAMSLGGWVLGRVGKLTAKLVPDTEVATPAAEALRRRMHWFLRRSQWVVGVLGLGLGAYALVSGSQRLSVATLAVAVMLGIAFRNGSDLSRTLVYARHDAALIRARGPDAPAGRLVAPLLAITLFGNAVLLGLWTALMFLAQEGTKAVLGVGLRGWVLVLWGLGIVLGGTVARRVAAQESRFLLREELAVGVFLGLVRARAKPADP